MTAQRFDIELPEDVVAALGWAEGEVATRVRAVLVMALLRQHSLSQGQAAALLQLNRRDLAARMGRYKVPASDVTPDHP